MPRRLIKFEAGRHYHFYNRGVNRQEIFFEPRNYRFFLEKIEQYLMPVLDIPAYCLMPNHYHLVVYVKETSEVFKTSEVSMAMMRLSVSYTKSMNSIYDRVGPLFQGAFQAKSVDTEAYLWHLIGYVHLNPVETGLVKCPGEWPFSSYQSWLELGGLQKLPRL